MTPDIGENGKLLPYLVDALFLHEIKGGHATPFTTSISYLELDLGYKL